MRLFGWLRQRPRPSGEPAPGTPLYSAQRGAYGAVDPAVAWDDGTLWIEPLRLTRGQQHRAATGRPKPTDLRVWQ